MALVFDRQVFEIEVPIADGSVAVIQDVYNSIRRYEALSANMDLRSLASASGKQPLGGTSQVGITLSLQQTWLLGFEARPGPAMIACLVNGGNLTASHTDTGAATAIGTTILTDTDGTFARHGAQTGDVVRNVTDGSEATIVTVDSETALTHTALTGGTTNMWSVNDVWETDTTHPLYPTSFVHISFAQDAAPVALDLSSIIGVVPDEVHLAVSYAEGSTTLRLGIWLDRNGSSVLAPTSATISWYNADGTLLFTTTDVGPDAQGHFSIALTQALADDTAYYAIVSVTDTAGTVTTRRGVPTAGT